MEPDGPARLPHLREVLAVGAVRAGLALRDCQVPGVMSDAQARQAASRWGIAPPGQDLRPQRGGGVVVVLVDGLGLSQLRERAGHARRLRQWLAQADGPDAGRGAARTCCPSTTAAALTTLGTSALPGRTGMVGYSVRRPGVPPATRAAACERVDPAGTISLITWQEPGASTSPTGHRPAAARGHGLRRAQPQGTVSPRSWQEVPTLFERLELPAGSQRRTDGQSVPRVVSVGPARFAGSGLTEAALRGAAHLAADRVEDRADRAAAALRRGTPLVYLYVGELDHAGHHHGWRSQPWLAELERADAMLERLARRVPAGTTIIVTADHGMIDTDPSHRLTLTDSAALRQDVAGVAGEPRLTHLYTWGADEGERAGRARQVAERWRAELGARAAWVATAQELAEAGAECPLGELGPRARGVVGDVVVAMAGRWVVVDPRVHSEQAAAMPGVHGSVTQEEVLVPLLVTQA